MSSFCGLTDKKTNVMGILNVTPDSFSDGGKFLDCENALTHTLEILGDGADIIDIGACSTRPGSVPVDEKTEIRRLIPVLDAIKREKLFSRALFSVDTFNANTAEMALDYGVKIINDVSGKVSPNMLYLAKKYTAGIIFTHNPENTDYKYGIAADVNLFFSDAVRKSKIAGLNFSQICLDPGFGFGKNREQNIELLNALPLLKRNNVFTLCGVSRKRFLDKSDEKTHIADILADCNIIRVHDVKNAVETIKIADELSYGQNNY